IGFSNLGSVVLNGTAFNDTVTVQSMPSSPVMVNGGGGANNTLTGPDTANAWLLAQPSGHEGTLNGSLVFDAFGSVIGGQGHDSFIFNQGYGLTTVDGGPGNNTLDFSPYFLVPPGWAFAVLGPNSGLVAGVIENFSKIQNLIGTQTNDRFAFRRTA